MSKYYRPLLPGAIYHLFSRAVGKEKLFLEQRNYHFFLNKLQQHTGKVANVMAYCLLPNHFHLVVQIKNTEEIIQVYNQMKTRPFDGSLDMLSDFTMERFSNLLNSYAKSFNKIYKRRGALFMDYMRRNLAEDDYLTRTFILYTHRNALHHGLVNDMGEWMFDSYNILLGNTETWIRRDLAFLTFGDRKKFVDFHQTYKVLRPYRSGEGKTEQNHPEKTFVSLR
jgi:REP element-mobilizing transposase RayT